MKTKKEFKKLPKAQCKIEDLNLQKKIKELIKNGNYEIVNACIGDIQKGLCCAVSFGSFDNKDLKKGCECYGYAVVTRENREEVMDYFDIEFYGRHRTYELSGGIEIKDMALWRYFKRLNGNEVGVPSLRFLKYVFEAYTIDCGMFNDLHILVDVPKGLKIKKRKKKKLKIYLKDILKLEANLIDTKGVEK